VLVGIAVVLARYWWHQHDLADRVDHAPVPADWHAVRTITGHGVDALNGDHDPWAERYFLTTHSEGAAVLEGQAFLRRWGCANLDDAEIPSFSRHARMFQTDCGDLNATLTVSNTSTLFASKPDRFLKAPQGGAVVTLWICNLSSLGG
jgi:hypothetical protein